MAERHENFVDTLAADPDNIPEMVSLSGFVGKSSLADHTRLYLNVVLSEYYEIPTDAILHSIRLPASVSPFGVSCLWIKGDAELIRRGKTTTETKARFFSGDIQKNYAAAAAAAGPTGVKDCTQAPPVCGDTAWKGCPH
ncbi:hypothetical protein [Methylogaea oryzae]|uniref:Uncharacterized protein n=1 Tax=Methylogaea oryzae TaxID=1295382 RepID=A0A8D4VP64_9GAMM|nr:hypothetical protein [Methylogaea oryzae]BBL70809.1 hypothetical protein MoryE10_14150 [Methylogaea oryzae]